jgi:hypothetical protein
MSENSFIREVDEELRRDQLKGLWNRFGYYVIGAAVLIVLATAGYRGYEYYQTRAAAASAEKFMAAIKASSEDRHDEAIDSLGQLAASGSGNYPALARMRIAIELAQKSDATAAIAQFDTVAVDGGAPEAFRSVARLRAGLLAVDNESYDEVKARLDPLAEPGAPYRFLAREGLGLAALKAGADAEAAQRFQSIVDDAGASGNVVSRARIMLDLLAGRGVTTSG